ncbi:alpha/beta hydrolase [Saccharospirillum sp. MSK14-1]|uniref:alpha/beta fold hydrolase n=1 Tax=Saccharospirillum sp. MSK14-1 TaxID=1897632 RepID=UPI000D37A659|nr:alpha/beta fold hydrolase [Saccharospirillum sp. MSK14-1]PTY38512.1 alpha/beta hydrolase [Saccharospirillum sp. MSK14-1]
MLTNGPDQGTTLVLAHGAGAAMDSDFMNQLAEGLGQEGIRVLRFEFPYMAQRRETGTKRPPDRAPKLLSHFQDVLSELDTPRVFIGGKSMGGRMATLLAAELEVAGVCVYGYPFHPPGKPEKQRLDHLPEVRCPVLICQGERDALGNRNEVEGYRLPSHIDVHWLPDGDHSLKPRKASGLTHTDNLDSAIQRTRAFIDQYSAL